MSANHHEQSKPSQPQKPYSKKNGNPQRQAHKSSKTTKQNEQVGESLSKNVSPLG